MNNSKTTNLLLFAILVVLCLIAAYQFIGTNYKFAYKAWVSASGAAFGLGVWYAIFNKSDKPKP